MLTSKFVGNAAPGSYAFYVVTFLELPTFAPAMKTKVIGVTLGNIHNPIQLQN